MLCRFKLTCFCIAEFDRDQYKYVTVIPIERQLSEASAHSPISIQLPGQTYPMTLNSPTMSPYGNRSHDISHGTINPQEAPSFNSGLYSPVASTNQRLSDTGEQNHSYEQKMKFPVNFMGLSTTEDSPPTRNNPSFLISAPEDEQRLKIPANFMTSGTESDNESELTRKTQSQLLSSKFAKMGGKF